MSCESKFSKLLIIFFCLENLVGYWGGAAWSRSRSRVKYERLRNTAQDSLIDTRAWILESFQKHDPYTAIPGGECVDVTCLAGYQQHHLRAGQSGKLVCLKYKWWTYFKLLFMHLWWRSPPLPCDFCTVLHNYPASLREYCGRCRIQTRDLCPRSLMLYQRATTSPLFNLLF